MTEEMLQSAIEALCGRLGLWWHSCREPRRCAGCRGLTDLIIIGRRGMYFAELKALGGKLEPDQVRVRYLLLALGMPWRQWDPGDWRSGMIRAELKAIA